MAQCLRAILLWQESVLSPAAARICSLSSFQVLQVAGIPGCHQAQGKQHFLRSSDLTREIWTSKETTALRLLVMWNPARRQVVLGQDTAQTRSQAVIPSSCSL